MEVEDKFLTSEDLIKEYAAGRKNVTEEDAKDLLRITLKWLKQRLNEGDTYAIDTKLGIFYRDLNMEAFINKEFPRTKKEKTEEKLFINSLFKKKITRDYNNDEIELIKENTNNSPIKK